MMYTFDITKYINCVSIVSSLRLKYKRFIPKGCKDIETIELKVLAMHINRRNSGPPDFSALGALTDYTWQRHLAEKIRFKYIVYKTNNKYYEILTIYE